MKRSGAVYNKAAIKRGRALARWAATGMDLTEGPEKAMVMAKARVIAAHSRASHELGRMQPPPQEPRADAPGWSQAALLAAVIDDLWVGLP